LALVGRHAGSGVPLDVLDRPETFPNRQLQVWGRDIVLPIDEGFPLGLCRWLWQCAEPTITHRRAACTSTDAAAIFRGHVWYENLRSLIPAQPPARLREQVHARR